MKKFKAVLHTNGSGLWSEEKRKVAVLGLDVPYVAEDFGELRVYFSTRDWNWKKHGLIYTDNQFLRELKAALKIAGYDATGIDYSEQGMQGDDYVSLDVDKRFLKSYFKNYTPSMMKERD